MTEALRSSAELGVQHSRASASAVDFTAASRAGNAFTLPPWLTITCATVGRTTQVNASSVATGVGANVARARSVDGSTWGLSVEAARQNLCQSSEDVSAWTNTSATVAANASTAPDGAATADQVTWGAATNHVAAPGTLASASAGVITLWGKSAGGGNQGLLFEGTVAENVFVNLTAAWARFELSLPAGRGTTSHLDFGNAAGIATAGTGYVWGGQLEAGLYPSSYLPNVGAAQNSRAADVLSCAASHVAQNGYFDARLTVAPNYATAEQSVDHDLFFLDTNNRLFLQASSHKLVLRVGGADVLSTALTWSREQAITVRAAHTRRGRTLTVTGATSGNGTATAGAASAVTLPATAYLLGNATGAQECADLRAVLFARPR